jgi:hypothetical protein
MSSLNFWPILVASVVSFGIGALWYSPILFGREWMNLLKMSNDDLDSAKERGVAKLYFMQFIATLVMFTVIGFAISSMSTMSVSDGAFVGFLAWLGLIAPVSLGAVMWKRESAKLILIETIHYLVVLAIGAAIIGAWR